MFSMCDVIIIYPQVPLCPLNMSLGDKIIEADEKDHGLEYTVQQAVQVDLGQGIVRHRHDQTNTEKMDSLSSTYAFLLCNKMVLLLSISKKSIKSLLIRFAFLCN